VVKPTPTTLLPRRWEPREYQKALWKYLERGGKRADVVAHRRWGKDDVALNWAAACATERPGAYWHLLPEASQGRKAVWDAVNPHTGLRRIVGHPDMERLAVGGCGGGAIQRVAGGD